MDKKQKYKIIKVQEINFDDLNENENSAKLSYKPDYGQSYDFEQFLFKLPSQEVAIGVLKYLGYRQWEIENILGFQPGKKVKSYNEIKKSLKKRTIFLDLL